MSDALAKIVDGLYSRPLPAEPLYHYTSLDALQSILNAGGVWATDVHYFNDASELIRARDAFTEAARERQDPPGSSAWEVLQQFKAWLSERLPMGNMVFVTSFTEEGNLLSQWRGYCSVGRGVSIGIDTAYLAACAQRQAYRVGKCLYDWNDQMQVARSIVACIVERALERGRDEKKHPSQCFVGTFVEAENHVLHAAALMKNSVFREEREWRVVSWPISNYVENEISYRAGKSTLIPYRTLMLTDISKAVRLEKVIIGPTSQQSLSMTSLSKMLAKYRAHPLQGVFWCQISLREL